MPPPSSCPGCGSRLPPDAESCPNCPWSYQEARPEESALKSDGFRNGVLPVLFLLGIGLFMWKMGMFFFKQVEDNNALTASEESARQKAKLAVGMTADQAAEAVNRGTAEDLAAVRAAIGRQGGTPPSPPAGADGGADHPKPVDEEDAVEGSGSISIAPAAAPGAAPKPVREWKLRGHVYDLESLKPVSGATMVFTDNDTNFRAQSTTDSTGRYRIILPPLQDRGYLVAISKAGFAKAYLNPGTEGVSDMDKNRRRELSRELASTIAEPASLQPFSEEPLVTDFHLAPQR